MKKRLLICPICEQNGKKEVLGELDSQGNLVILRFKNSSTKIVSPHFLVQCGVCGEVAFYRKKKYDQ